MRDAVTLLAIAIIVASMAGCQWQRDKFDHELQMAKLQRESAR